MQIESQNETLLAGILITLSLLIPILITFLCTCLKRRSATRKKNAIYSTKTQIKNDSLINNNNYIIVSGLISQKLPSFFESNMEPGKSTISKEQSQTIPSKKYLDIPEKEIETNYLYFVTIAASIFENLFALLLIVFPEVNLLGSINTAVYYNPFYARLWASLIISFNSFYIYFMWYKNSSYRFLDLSNHDPSFAQTSSGQSPDDYYHYQREAQSAAPRAKKNNIVDTNNNNNNNNNNSDTAIISKIMLINQKYYILFSLHVIKAIYYIIFFWVGFVLIFIETLISNQYVPTNIGRTGITVAYFIFFVLTIFVSIIYVVVAYGNYQSIKKNYINIIDLTAAKQNDFPIRGPLTFRKKE
jgi:hypothetical protein